MKNRVYHIFPYYDTSDAEELKELLDAGWKIERADSQIISTGATLTSRGRIIYILYTEEDEK